MPQDLEVFERWADTAPRDGEKLPRSVGQIESRLRGLPLVRFAGSYTPFGVQRLLDDYRALARGERATIDSALAGSGWEPLLAHAPRHRVAKRGFELVLESDA
jgi:hypothetical protein